MSRRDDAIEAARRIVATDEGWPGADEEIEYLDAVAAARGLLCCTSQAPRGLTLWDAVWLGCVSGLALAVVLFALLMILTGGKP